MATFEQLMRAAAKADAAGDTAAARELVRAAQQVQRAGAADPTTASDPAPPPVDLTSQVMAAQPGSSGARALAQQYGDVEIPRVDAAGAYTPPPADEPPMTVERALRAEAEAEAEAEARAADAQGNPVTVSGALASGADGFRQGVSGLLGMPVDAFLGAAAGAASFATGREVRPAVTMSGLIDGALRLGGLIPDYQPRNGLERVVNRTGEELGGVLPTLGVPLVAAARAPLAAAGRTVPAGGFSGGGRTVAETLSAPYLANPGGYVGREVGYGAAAGLGAGAAREVVGPDAGLATDIVGSLGGTAGYGMATGLGRALLDAGMTLFGSNAMKVRGAEEVVADRLMGQSEDMQTRAATGQPLDTGPLAERIRTPTAAEELVPGFRSNLGDRSGDVGLMTFTGNVDARSAAAANIRADRNARAVGEVFDGIAPGDPSRFRGDLAAGVDARVSDAQTRALEAQRTMDAAVAGVQPVMPGAAARGSMMRDSLQTARDVLAADISRQFEDIVNRAPDVAQDDLRVAVDDVRRGLTPTEVRRAAPSAEIADIGAASPPAGPMPTDVERLAAWLDARDATVPARNVMSANSAIKQDTRTARAAGQGLEARVKGQYSSALDDELLAAMGDDLAAEYGAAQARRRDMGDRFDRAGTATERVLRSDGASGYRLNDAAVPTAFFVDDAGRTGDFKAFMRETAGDPLAREAMADTILADVQSRKLLDNPEQLQRYMDQRSIVLSEFPDLRTRLQEAGADITTGRETQRASAELEKNLTTPGRSPEASFLKYGPGQEDRAIREVIAAPDGAAAARDLVNAAATPTARADLRSAFWRNLAGPDKQMQAKTPSGTTRYRVGAMLKELKQPRSQAVAAELWADAPDELDRITQVMEALSAADGSSRTTIRSGTGQTLLQGHDPAMTTSSLASRMRSVNRGQLSPTIAVIDVASTWLRRRGAQQRTQLMDDLMGQVVNDPEFAAYLLEKYNPATAADQIGMLSQRWGARVQWLVQALQEEEGGDGADPLLAPLREK